MVQSVANKDATALGSEVLLLRDEKKQWEIEKLRLQNKISNLETQLEDVHKHEEALIDTVKNQQKTIDHSSRNKDILMMNLEQLVSNAQSNDSRLIESMNKNNGTLNPAVVDIGGIRTLKLKKVSSPFGITILRADLNNESKEIEIESDIVTGVKHNSAFANKKVTGKVLKKIKAQKRKQKLLKKELKKEKQLQDTDNTKKEAKSKSEVLVTTKSKSNSNGNETSVPDDVDIKSIKFDQAFTDDLVEDDHDRLIGVLGARLTTGVNATFTPRSRVLVPSFSAPADISTSIDSMHMPSIHRSMAAPMAVMAASSISHGGDLGGGARGDLVSDGHGGSFGHGNLFHIDRDGKLTVEEVLRLKKKVIKAKKEISNKINTIVEQLKAQGVNDLSKQRIILYIHGFSYSWKKRKGKRRDSSDDDDSTDETSTDTDSDDDSDDSDDDTDRDDDTDSDDGNNSDSDSDSDDEEPNFQGDWFLKHGYIDHPVVLDDLRTVILDDSNISLEQRAENTGHIKRTSKKNPNKVYWKFTKEIKNKEVLDKITGRVPKISERHRESKMDIDNSGSKFKYRYQRGKIIDYILEPNDENIVITFDFLWHSLHWWPPHIAEHANSPQLIECVFHCITEFIRVGLVNISIIAHSMGNYILLQLAKRLIYGGFGEVINNHMKFISAAAAVNVTELAEVVFLMRNFNVRPKIWLSYFHKYDKVVRGWGGAFKRNENKDMFGTQPVFFRDNTDKLLIECIDCTRMKLVE